MSFFLGINHADLDNVCLINLTLPRTRLNPPDFQSPKVFLVCWLHRCKEISVAASVPGETQALVVSVPATVARRPSVPQEAAPKAPPSPAAVPIFGDRTEMV